MSTAAKFGFAQALPFCASDISGSVPAAADYVGNLTLADAMEFAWNLENLSLTVALGTTATRIAGINSATVNAAFTASISPFASDVMTQGRIPEGNMMFGAATAYAVFASCPAIRQPVDRVCSDGTWLAGLVLACDWLVNTGIDQFAGIGFWVGTDPGNAGKYRVYYNFDLIRQATSSGVSVAMRWIPKSTLLPGYSAVTNGTMTIEGITLSWYCSTDGNSAVSGGGLSATSSSFTY